MPSPPLIENWNEERQWTTARLAPEKQFGRWRQFVNEAHMQWDIETRKIERFPALIRHGRWQGYRMTHQTSEVGGIVGYRGRAQISQDGDATYNLLYLLSGAVRLEMGSTECSLGPGSCVLWDSTRPMQFAIGPDLHQITFSIPRDVLRHQFGQVDRFVGLSLRADQTSSMRLWIEHLKSLDRCFGDLTQSEAARVLDASSIMLTAALESAITPEPDPAHSLLRAICERARKCLDDESLTTAKLAAISGVSERHLYRLFAMMATTPSGWIRTERLKACYHDLMAPLYAHQSIFDVALRWGFRDAGSFAKIFRRAFGKLPSELRAVRPPPDVRADTKH